MEPGEHVEVVQIDGATALVVCNRKRFPMVTLIVLAVIAALVLLVVARTVQDRPAGAVSVLVERLGRYQRTLSPGMAPPGGAVVDRPCGP